MTANKQKLSVLVPSRERADSLKFSLDSLGLSRNKIEALIWVDDDDPQLTQYKKFFEKKRYIKLFIEPRVEYLKFHVMMNFLASKARGDWLMLWNDDAYMKDASWYDNFMAYASLSNPKKEPVVYNIRGEGKPQNLFPFVSRKYYELVGHIAQNCICDVWVKTVAHESHIQRYIYGIKPRHRKSGDDDNLGDLLDNTHDSIQELYKRSRFLGSRNPSAFKGRNLDRNKILDWIKESKNRNLRVGFVGLGKLGLPVALAIESRGKNVVAYDIDPNVSRYIKAKKIPFQEEGADKLLQISKIEMVSSIEEVVKKCNLVFCAVQTPHDPKFEGDKPIKDSPVDFDYSYLKKAVKNIVKAADKLSEKTTLVVVSTCLPGTYEREIKPLLSPKINYVYNPFFIAMGTVVHDFLNPEFVLIGNDDGDTAPLTNFYKMMLGQDKSFITDITTAEGIKVLYNTYITSKIVFANNYGELAHKVGMNADDIYRALSLATDRIISAKYLKAGVGDGGACHPRDNIALSHLAQKYKLSYDIFEGLMVARQKHMTWLARIAKEESKASGLPIVILGKSFKPESGLETGSAAILLANILKDMGTKFSHWEFDYPSKLPVAVYIVATQHDRYTTLEFPKGSTIVDPFRYIKGRERVKVISVGGKR